MLVIFKKHCVRQEASSLIMLSQDVFCYESKLIRIHTFMYYFLIQATCYYMLGLESNGLEPDQDQHFFSSDQGPNCLQRLLQGC